ncbi:retrotransposable element Tf2 [Tanacetum coccineum]
MRKDKWVVGKDVELRKKLIDHFHGSVVGGYSRVQATTKRLITYFYWKDLRKMVKEWVRTCDVCQRHKSDLSAYPGFLQPLHIPDKIWQDLSMDFIKSLPMSQGKSSLLALHGLPKTIVSDRDKVFMSLFWQSIFKKMQFKLKMSTAYHPQTDRQTEIVNKCLDTYLRCMTGETPKDWVKWVPLAEYWYNTNYHSVLDTTPYEVVYGQTPPMHIYYMAKDSPVEAVDRNLQAREQVFQFLKFNLKKAQDRIKSQADKRRADKSFQVNDWVYLKLQPCRKLTMRQGGQHKLSSKFFGPFQVPCYIDSAAMGSFLLFDSEGLLAATPLKILDRRMVKQNNRMVVFRLIQWSNGSEEDATWEKLEDLLARFPEFSLDP